METFDSNSKYINSLKEITALVNKDKYLVVGSIALLSFTCSNGYDRQIHDIDIIMDVTEAQALSVQLKALGYRQNTFINKRMPFYSKLMNFAENKYLRFSKGGIDVEILATSMKERRGLVYFELYPKIEAGVPKDEFQQSTYMGVTFSTLSKEMLYFFMKFASNTLGRKVDYKEGQRYNDLQNLRKLVDMERFASITNAARLSILGINLRVPSFLLK